MELNNLNLALTHFIHKIEVIAFGVRYPQNIVKQHTVTIPGVRRSCAIPGEHTMTF